MNPTLIDGINAISYILALAFIITWFLPIQNWVSLIVSACIFYAGYINYKNGKRNKNRAKQDN